MNAIVIGWGPSARQNLDYFENLGKFPGIVLCVDSALAECLSRNIIPDVCVTLEDNNDLGKYFIPPIVKEKGHLVPVLTAERTHQNTIDAIINAGMSYQEATSCRDYNNTSNVGLYAWLVANKTFHCDNIFLLGMNCCYELDVVLKIDQNSELFKYGFYKIWNRYTDKQYILNPAHELWKEEFEYYVKLFKNIRTVNLTGDGSLCREMFEWKPISKVESWNDIC